MKELQHKVVHRVRDADGVLEVIDDPVTRTLYFGSRAKQSSMLLCHEQVLVLTYTQAMTAALLFQPAPRSVLIIGLGGGSLAKFFHHHFPDCQVHAVESRPEVINIAHQYFALPNDARLQVHSGDALEYLAQPTQQAFDIIMVDIYDAQGMDVSLEDESFFARCRERLNQGGVLSANLWATNQGVCRQHVKTLARLFAGQLLELPAPHCGNLIALGLTREFPVRQLPSLSDHAAALQERFGIDYPDYLDRMRRRNRFLLRRLFR